jgi:hypothetical protein
VRLPSLVRRTRAVMKLTPSSADRVQRLKDARAEAGKEIDEYKKTKDNAFKAFEESVRAPRPPPVLIVR